MEHNTELRDPEDLRPGDHACLIYKDEPELKAVVTAIWQECLRKKWRLLYIARLHTGDEVRERFLPPTAHENSSQVQILSSADPTFHRSFSTASMAEGFIRRQIEEAEKSGYSTLCIMREAPSIPHDSHSSRWLTSDMGGLEALFQQGKIILICGYMADSFPSHVLQDVLRTHPVAIIGTEVVENVFYIPSSDARRYHLPSLEVKHWIQTLLGLKSARKALMESEARYRDLLENANDLIQSVSPEGKFLFVNKAWRETLGYTREEVEKLTIFDIIDPPSVDHCRNVFRRVMSGEEIRRIETVFINRSGKKIFVEGNVNCCITEGKPLYTRAVFRDVTEITRERRAREEQEQVLEVILGLAPHPAMVVDREGVVLHANRAARSLVSGGEKMNGASLFQLFGAGGEEAIREGLEAIKSSREYTTRSRIKGAGGNEWTITWRNARLPYQPPSLFLVVLQTPGKEEKDMDSPV